MQHFEKRGGEGERGSKGKREEGREKGGMLGRPMSSHSGPSLTIHKKNPRCLVTIT